MYDNFFTVSEKVPSTDGYSPSDFWYTGMQKNSDGLWAHQYVDHSDPIQYTNWAPNSYTGDSSRDMILVVGDSNDGGSSRDRGEWIAGHSQASSQFYSIIEYPVTIENNVDLPAPFGPSKPTSSFSFSFKEILFKAKKEP